MYHELTLEEIRDAARTARVYCPGFTEEKFESLMELERRITDSGYLEAVQGLARLEGEMGISCAEAIDACKRLAEQKTKLEPQIPILEKSLESLLARIKQANAKYNQLEGEIAKARQELEQIRNEHVSAEKKLEAFNRTAEKEKQRINKEVEDCHHHANVTKEEVEAAGRIKAGAESRGVSLELVMDISQELAGQGNAREQLLLAIKKHNSLTGYLRDLKQWAEQRKTEEMSHISSLQLQAGQVQTQVNALEETRRGIERVITELQANIAEEEELRRFYWRYQGHAGLLELLAGWERLVFYRCNNLMSAATRVLDDSKVAHFWTDKPAACCPHCGLAALVFDDKPYQALGLPAGTDFKIQLG